MNSIEVDVDVSDAMRRLGGMQVRINHFRPVLMWARDELEKSNAKNFATNGLQTGKAWSPLDPQYGAWKSIRFPGAPTNVRSGRLFRSLTNLRGVPNVIGDDSAQFGTSVPYAKFHQYGTSNMPKRQVVFEPPLFAKRLASRAVDYVSNGVIK